MEFWTLLLICVVGSTLIASIIALTRSRRLPEKTQSLEKENGSLREQLRGITVRVYELEKTLEKISRAGPESSATEAGPATPSVTETPAVVTTSAKREQQIERPPAAPVSKPTPPATIPLTFPAATPRPSMPPPQDHQPNIMGKTLFEQNKTESRSWADLEERLGANWLNKMGTAAFVIGVALLLNYSMHYLGPRGKIVLGYSLSSVLVATGVFGERTKRYRIAARYLVADTEREAERIPLVLTQVSDAEEMKAGLEVAEEDVLFSRRDWSVDDLSNVEYLNKVGTAVASHVERRAIHYRFFLDGNKNWVDACALPGGYIIVGRGLLDLMQSEDELAAVLGHEIAHVDNRHAIERLQYELASRKLGLEGIYQLGRPAVEIFKAGYTKQQEREADRVGLELAVEAGYSPAGVLKLMERFERFESQYQQPRAGSPIEEIAGVPISAFEEYFRSHPPASERKAALEREIRARNWNEAVAERPLAIRHKL